MLLLLLLLLLRGRGLPGVRALGSRLYSVVKSRIRWPLKAALSLGLQPVGCETREREREREQKTKSNKKNEPKATHRETERQRGHTNPTTEWIEFILIPTPLIGCSSAGNQGRSEDQGAANRSVSFRFRAVTRYEGKTKGLAVDCYWPRPLLAPHWSAAVSRSRAKVRAGRDLKGCFTGNNNQSGVPRAKLRASHRNGKKRWGVESWPLFSFTFLEPIKKNVDYLFSVFSPAAIDGWDSIYLKKCDEIQQQRHKKKNIG